MGVKLHLYLTLVTLKGQFQGQSDFDGLFLVKVRTQVICYCEH